MIRSSMRSNVGYGTCAPSERRRSIGGPPPVRVRERDLRCRARSKLHVFQLPCRTAGKFSAVIAICLPMLTDCRLSKIRAFHWETWTWRRMNCTSKHNSPIARSVAVHENAFFGSHSRESLVEGGELSPSAYRSLQVRRVIPAEAVAAGQRGDLTVILIAVGLE